MKKRTLWYLFDRYLGHFLSEKLTLDQLSIDVIDGKGCINEISLDVDSLNEELSFLPLTFLPSCFIQEISVCVPWSSLLTQSCSLHLNGAIFYCFLLSEKGKSVVDSDYLSRSFMSSSMQMAEEIVGDVNNDQFEGLEIFAQLIDSVLRRIEVVAINTSVILKPPESMGSVDQTQIEFKIKYLKCEENVVVKEELSDSSTDVTNAPKVISKRLTIENVEIFIDDSFVCHIEGKHTMEIKLDDTCCDIQLCFASFLYAFLKHDHIDKILQIIKMSSHDKVNRICVDKMMNSTDYARIEQQLQRDVTGYSKPSSTLANSLLNCGPNTWTCGRGSGTGTNLSSSLASDAKFLPLTDIPIDENNFLTKADSNVKHFRCTIKLPAIVLCIVNSSSSIQSLPSLNIDQSTITLETINASVNSTILTPHLCFIAMPIQININPDNLSITSNQMKLCERTEYVNRPMCWASSDETDSLNFKIKFKEQTIDFVSSICTNITIDPTFLERVDDFFKSNDSSGSSKYLINFFSKTVKLKLLFPIPDLRPEKKLYSSLREESIECSVTNFSLTTNLLSYEIIFDSIKMFLVASSVSYGLLEAQSQVGKKISINIKRGPSAINPFESDLNKTLNDADMEESIYINCSEKVDMSPFVTKRKVIKSTKDENEQIVSPNDRQTSLKYFETCQSLTQFQIELSAPILFVKLKNKQVLNILYNRLGNDLAIWTPIKTSHAQLLDDITSPLLNPFTNSKIYFTCKSGLIESTESESSFHSVDVTMNKMQNLATSICHIEKLYLDLGETDNHHSLVCDDFFMGFVIGLCDDRSNVFSINGFNIEWHFNGKPIIGTNYFGLASNAINLTVETIVNPNKLKEIKFALQLTDSLLFKESLTPFKSFWNFIDVENESILGYQPWRTQVELHINLLNGALLCSKANCRQALITMECGYLTSMVVENTHQTLLRVITEEACLYFIKNNLSRYDMRNYVCIVDSGLIDLNLKIFEDSKIDFKASNNIINIRACYDSLDALCQLVVSLIQDTEPSAKDYGENLPSNLVDEAKEDNHMINSDLIEDAINDVEERYCDGKPNSCNCESNQMDDSGFWLLGDDDIGSGIKATVDPKVRVLTTEPIEVIENYHALVSNRPYAAILSALVDRYLLEEMTLVIYLYGGRDFDESSSQAEKEEKIYKMEEDTFQPTQHVNSKYEETRIRFMDNSVLVWENIDLKSTLNHNPNPYLYTASNLRTHGGKLRQNDVCVQLSLFKLKSVFDKYDETSSMPWRFNFMVNSIEIRDRVSKSKIKKMLYEYSSETMPQRKSSNMIIIRANTFRNTTDLHEECDLKISVKPLRINIDQDTIMFLIDFFDRFKSLKFEEGSLKQSTKVKPSSIDVDMDTLDDNIDFHLTTAHHSTSASSKPPSLYIKSFMFSPDVPIRLDYHGKRVDFEQVKVIYFDNISLNKS